MKKSTIILLIIFAIVVILSLFVKVYPVNIHSCGGITDWSCGDYINHLSLFEVIKNNFNWVVDLQLTDTAPRIFSANKIYLAYYIVFLLLCIFLLIFLTKFLNKKKYK